MTAIWAILRANPLAFGLGAALLLSATGFSAQTWRLGNAQERIGEIRAQISQCVFANASNQTTIDALRAAQAENEAKRVAALEAQRKAAQRARELQIELNQRGTSDVRIIERTVDNCADSALPDAIRLRFAPSGDGDGNRDGVPGSSGAGQ